MDSFEIVEVYVGVVRVAYSPHFPIELEAALLLNSPQKFWTNRTAVKQPSEIFGIRLYAEHVPLSPYFSFRCETKCGTVGITRFSQPEQVPSLQGRISSVSDGNPDICDMFLSAMHRTTGPSYVLRSSVCRLGKWVTTCLYR